jgi:hypothetical protein
LTSTRSPVLYVEQFVARAAEGFIFGAAYCDSRPEKVRFYRQAMRMNERAMYTNPDFRQRVDQGQTPWDACEALTRNEIDAMFYWVTAVLYYFKEGMNLPEKIVNSVFLIFSTPRPKGGVEKIQFKCMSVSQT